MITLETKHLLTGAELSKNEIESLLQLAGDLKSKRKEGLGEKALRGKTLGLFFDKPSLRTRLSFTVAMQELGGHVVESIDANRKVEEPKDTMRVAQGYCHGIMFRTFEHEILEQMKEVAKVPIINGLTDTHHPCQILSDLLTLKERFGNLQGLNLAYIGDGNNILHSLMIIAPLVGINIRYCCPSGYQPHSEITSMAQLKGPQIGTVRSFSSPAQAVENCQAIYTDVWTSMGFEGKNPEKELVFEGFQLNEDLMKKADPSAVALHCLPMVRGQEISKTLPDSPASAIFEQSENRLHMQKALLLGLLGEG